MAESRIEKLDRKIALLEAQRDLALRRARAAERKRDTRRKILIGAYLIKSARQDDAEAIRLIEACVAAQKGGNAKPFDAWERYD